MGPGTQQVSQHSEASTNPEKFAERLSRKLKHLIKDPNAAIPNVS